MPQQQNSLDILQRLQQLRRPSGGGEFVDRRRGDIESGIDQFGPTQGELLEEQQRGNTSMMGATGGAFGHTRSRDSIREDFLQQARRSLGLGEIEHRQQLEREVVPAQIKGAYDVESSRVSAEAAEARAESSANNIMERLMQRDAATAERQQVTQGGLGDRLDDRQQFSLENPSGGSQGAVPQGLYDALTEAEGNRPSGAISRFLDFGGAKENAYESSLTNVLQRTGQLQGITLMANDLQNFEGSLDERLNQLIGQLPDEANRIRGIDLRERQFLQMKLGVE